MTGRQWFFVLAALISYILKYGHTVRRRQVLLLILVPATPIASQVVSVYTYVRTYVKLSLFGRMTSRLFIKIVVR